MRSSMKCRKSVRPLRILVTVFFLSGVVILLWPDIRLLVTAEKASSFEKEIHISDKEETVPADKDPLYESMRIWNERLASREQNVPDASGYEEDPFSLSTDNDIFATVKAEDMNLYMPVTIGADDEHLLYSAAVLGNTSMPLGGSSTHCVLAVHRDPFCLDIEKMCPGSLVEIVNPWETLIYRCKEIKVISQTDVRSLRIEKDKDLLTIMTCHPYTGNARYRYRLLVVCERVSEENDVSGSAGTDISSENENTAVTERETAIITIQQCFRRFMAAGTTVLLAVSVFQSWKGKHYG